MEPTNPIQPLVMVNGVLRFKENRIVSYLLDFARRHGCGMNELARMDFSADDRMQFAQLIGYSHSGAGDLEYISNEVWESAERMFTTGEDEQAARLAYFQELFKTLRSGLREPMAALYQKHPDDFEELEP